MKIKNLIDKTTSFLFKRLAEAAGLALLILSVLLLISLSLSLIIWVIQAVNFLDYIAEDGHGLKTYFSITLLSSLSDNSK